MKGKKEFLLPVLFLSFSSLIFARGTAEENARATINNEWILCVTEFDISSVPEDKMIAAGFITQRIVERLKTINHRTRAALEYEYYKEYAWTRAISNAAGALAAKQEERARFIFQGEPAWRYRRNLANIDADIESLREALHETENNPPLIENEPLFRLTSGNMSSVFPSLPEEGDEFKFCTDENADAFLSGTLIDFHGRFLLILKLYTVYTRSFVWEDSIIFSTEDIENALEEITRRLISVLSGTRSSAIIVRAEPEDALLLINNTYAGRGETGLTEFTPGTYTIIASARGYESITAEIELGEGELVEIDIRLSPIETASVEIFHASSRKDSFNEGDALYHGSLFLGETPLQIDLPVNSLELLELETLDGRRGVVALELASNNNSFTFNPLFIETLPSSSINLVERERRRYYMAWGATWVAGIAAWVVNYSYSSSNNAVIYSSLTGNLNDDFYNNNRRMANISTGINIALGAVVVYGIYRVGRYIYTANQGAPSIARRGRNR